MEKAAVDGLIGIASEVESMKEQRRERERERESEKKG